MGECVKSATFHVRNRCPTGGGTHQEHPDRHGLRGDAVPGHRDRRGEDHLVDGRPVAQGGAREDDHHRRRRHRPRARLRLVPARLQGHRRRVHATDW